MSFAWESIRSADDHACKEPVPATTEDADPPKPWVYTGPWDELRLADWELT